MITLDSVKLALFENSVTGIFVLLMLLFFLIGFITLFRKKYVDFKSVIISMGILGTFIGIFSGLLEFNTMEIKKSIPLLLEGLKTAFLTSIAGMVLSITLSILEKFRRDEVKKEASLNEILHSIDDKLSNLSRVENIEDKLSSMDRRFKNLSEHILIVKEDISKEFKAIRDIHLAKLNYIKATSSTVETLSKIVMESSKEIKDSINMGLTPIVEGVESIDGKMDDLDIKLKSIDKNLQESMDKMNSNLEIAIEELTKGVTKEIIKSLESVIMEFNNNLADKFGDNFKELNEAVKNMVVWQENYKSSIDRFEESLSTTVSYVNSFTKDMATIQDEYLKGIDRLQKTLNSYLNQINNVNEKIAQMSSGYKEIDLIHKELLKVTKLGSKQMDRIDKHMKGVVNSQEEINLMINNLSRFSNKIDNVLTEQSKRVDELLKESYKLKEEIREELPASLGELNKALASLTNKFKDDYKEFLNHMRKIIKAND